MRKLVFLLIFFMICSCQDKKDRKKDIDHFFSPEFSLEGIPVDVEKIIISEFIKDDSARTRKCAEEILKAAGFSSLDDETSADYLAYYRKALTQSNQTDPEQKFYNEVSDKLAEKGGSVVNNLSSERLKQDINYLLPITIKKAFRESIDSVAVDVINRKLKITTGRYIELRLSLMHEKGIDLIGKERKEFEQYFAKGTKAIKVINSDSLFGKLIPRIAYNYVQKNKQFQYLKIKSEKIDSLINNLNNSSTNLILQAGNLVRKEMIVIDASIGVLLKNEEKAIALADTLCRKAQQLNDEIASIDVRLKQITLTLAERTSLTLQKEKYLKTAYLLGNVVKQYQSGNLDSRKILSSIDNKYINSILTIDEKFKEIKSLVKNFAEVNLETLSAISMKVVDNLQMAAVELERLDILKGKDAQNAGKFIKYLSGSIQVGTGVAKTFNGDPSGVFNVISGLSGIFGKKKDPSPEMQMVNYMKSRFDFIDQKLDAIDIKLTSLNNLTVQLYKDMTENFKLMQAQLGDLKNDVSLIIVRVNLQLYSEYFTCLTNFIKDKSPYETYTDYQNQHAFLGTCLSGLEKISNPNARLNYFLINLNPMDENPEDKRVFQKMIFAPMVAYFNSKYLSDDAKMTALYTGIFPISTPGRVKPSEIIADRLSFSSIPTNTELLNTVTSGKTFMDVDFLYQFTLTYLKYSNYFIFNKNSEYYQPYSLREYLDLTKQQKMQASEVETEHLKHLYKICSYALIQQSLLSGNELVYDLLESMRGADNEKNKKLAFECLQNNTYLKSNYAKILLTDYLFSKSQDQQNYKTYSNLFDSDTKGNSAELSKNLSQINSAIDKTGQRKYLNLFYDNKQKQIKLSIKTPLITDSITMNAPLPEEFLDDKLYQSPGVNKMLELQEKLRLKLVNADFNTSLTKNSKKEAQQVFKALLTMEQFKKNLT